MSGSLRVIRHDTGQAVEIPADSLRWGPDTKLGTCRAALTTSCAAFGGAISATVPYFLPFPGAKFAVRVTLAGPAVSPPASHNGLAASFRGVLEAAGIGPKGLDDEIFALAKAALAKGVASETPEPDPLGEALELLAECLPLVQELRARVGDEVAKKNMAGILHRGHALLGLESADAVSRAYQGSRAGSACLNGWGGPLDRAPRYTLDDVRVVQDAVTWLCSDSNRQARAAGIALSALADRLTEARWRGDV